MKKLSIKNIIDFKRGSEKVKINFVNNLNIDKSNADQDGGGDYWISSLSAISNSFKTDSQECIKEKIEELGDKIKKTDFARTKEMYERNITILETYNSIDNSKWKPNAEISFIKKYSFNSILTIKGLGIQVLPHHVYSFNHDDQKQIGAIWFVAKLDKLTIEELGMFTEVLYQYLNLNFSQEYFINDQFCIAVDVSNNNQVSYSQLKLGEVPNILNLVLEEIVSLIKQ